MKYNQWMKYKINESVTYAYVFSKDLGDNYWTIVVNIEKNKISKRFGSFATGFIFDLMEPSEYIMDNREEIQLIFENKTP
jgi:hypothetical protein